VPRRARLGEQSVRGAQLTLPGDLIATDPRQRGALDVDPPPPAPRTGLLDQGRRAVERVVDGLPCSEAVGATEDVGNG
jgi:hypothetical protein